jgi:type VI protein secretion system component Hcp
MYRITIEDLTITQIKPQFTKKDAEPREEISFGFRSITWEFYSADGKTVTPRTGWNNEMKKAI